MSLFFREDRAILSLFLSNLTKSFIIWCLTEFGAIVFQKTYRVTIEGRCWDREVLFTIINHLTTLLLILVHTVFSSIHSNHKRR